MKFCWKFKKIIDEQIFIKFGKTYSKIVDNLLKNRENLLINKDNLVKNEENNVNYWYLKIIDNPMIRNKNDGKIFDVFSVNINKFIRIFLCFLYFSFVLSINLYLSINTIVLKLSFSYYLGKSLGGGQESLVGGGRLPPPCPTAGYGPAYRVLLKSPMTNISRIYDTSL